MIDTAALREKILNLAIRGKLVPQDPNDEPASKLLERIRAQKLQMVKEGKLKAKDVKDDTIIYLNPDDNCHYEKFADGTVKNIEDEIPFDFLESWKYVRFKNIFILISGRDLAPSEYSSLSKGIPYITGASNFNKEKVEIVRWTTNPQVISFLGDLLLTVKGTVGEIAFNNLGDAHIARQVVAIRNLFDFNGEFLMYVMQYYINTLKTNAKGLIPGISRDDILNLIIPIPPKDEQLRIVSKLKKLFEIINFLEKNKSELETTKAVVKSKILDLAIQGKLVSQDENDEPASVLLERIRAEKKAQLGKKYVESYIYKGDDNCYYEKVCKNCIEITEEIGFEVPNKWAICRFDEVANIYTGNSINESEKAKKYTGLSEGYNYIATKDISFNHSVDYNNGIKIPFGDSKFRIAYKGDSLLCIEGGSAGRKLAILNEDVCFVNKLCAFHSLGITSKFLYFYIQSPRFLELFKKNTSGLIGGVSINVLKSFIVTIPPIAEQERIVIEIAKIFSMLDQLEESLNYGRIFFYGHNTSLIHKT